MLCFGDIRSGASALSGDSDQQFESQPTGRANRGIRACVTGMCRRCVEVTRTG